MKRNPQDLTLRNLRALKKRVAKLEEVVKYLDYTLNVYGRVFSLFEIKFEKFLEKQREKVKK